MVKQCAVTKKTVKDGKEIIVCDETRSKLLPVLQGIQQKKGYISDKDMQETADRFGIHPVEVYSVVTFYAFLTSGPKARHTIRISNCMPNIMAGSGKIQKEFEKALKIKKGRPGKYKNIVLEETGCIGMCDQAPAALIDGELVGNITPKDVKDIVRRLSKKPLTRRDYA
ncbi:MAG: NAD(P)H-dependent oxidoreductase subunit E [Candidatus Omnitrophica bacterium]|jgi:NADH:ubiquinone oxidoreductase subunit E|nr:NAD(P)H-dependent oxidoreductase subunit E [Candidatus Omnitrophota bacterium]